MERLCRKVIALAEEALKESLGSSPEDDRAINLDLLILSDVKKINPRVIESFSSDKGKLITVETKQGVERLRVLNVNKDSVNVEITKNGARIPKTLTIADLGYKERGSRSGSSCRNEVCRWH